MAAISEQENKMLNIQLQMKQNNEDLKNFLGDLDNWEKEMKQIDSNLKNKKPLEDAVICYFKFCEFISHCSMKWSLL